MDTIVGLGIVNYVFDDLTKRTIESSSLSFSCEKTHKYVFCVMVKLFMKENWIDEIGRKMHRRKAKFLRSGSE